MKQSKSNFQDNENSRFITGIVLGFLVGISGYLLLNSKEGQQLRKKLKSHWDQAKDNLPQLEDFKLGDVPLEDLIDIIFGEKNWTDLDAATKKPLLRSTSKPKKQRKKPRKFKGV
ncbi:MAG: YtxH domain-containing protein [Patescibacteria group bacterium]|nr:YtxH domain-containing protein [Patescibacteria group bacterium]